MLKVKDLNVHYGKIHAIKGISFEVNEGEIVTLIGANGAGKTTILQTISGLLKPSEGMISFEGENLNKVPAHQIPVMGIAHVPEGRRIFAEMTVYENLQMGAFPLKDRSIVSEQIKKVYHLFPRLEERQSQYAGTLSGGEQQMLAIARALMSRPKLLLLDEPSLGLAPIIIKDIFKELRRINEENVTILIVEQNARQALLLSHRGYVLQTGRVVLEGDSKDLLVNPEVTAAYLGTGATRSAKAEKKS